MMASSQSLTEEVFTFLPTYNALICRDHKYTVRSTEIRSHLRKQHPQISAGTRGEIISYLSENYSGNITFPSQPVEPIGLLPVYSGTKCTNCSYICLNPKSITDHYRSNHRDIYVPQKEGGYRRKNQPEKSEKSNTQWTSVKCQQFFTAGADRRYFEVLDTQNNENTIDTENTDVQASIISIGMKKLTDRTKEITEKAKDTITEPGKLDANAWLARTGWTKHLLDFDLTTARSWLKVPERTLPDESNYLSVLSLYMINRSIQVLFRKAVLVSKANTVGQNSIEFVNRKETGNNTNEKPFIAYIGLDSIDNYTDVWRGIFNYLWNTRAMTDRPGYRYTELSKGLFTKTLRIAKGLVRE